MALNATVRARVDPELKEEVETIFKKLGLTTSQAINLFLTMVRREGGIPFDLKVSPQKDKERRRVERKKGMKVTKTALHDRGSALHVGLSPLKSWELVSRISKESWYLETGEAALSGWIKAGCACARGDIMCLTSDYRDMIELFNEHGVRYVVAGAYAMATFGYSRSTYDIDLWIERSGENAQKVLAALDDFGVPFELMIEDFCAPNRVIQIGTAPIRIDILADVDGVVFEAAYAGRKVVKMDGLEVSVINLDDLIKNKAASGRAKGKIDCMELEKIRNRLGK